MSPSEALPTTAIDIMSVFARRSAKGYRKWRTCPSSLRGCYSGIWINDLPVERHRLKNDLNVLKI